MLKKYYITRLLLGKHSRSAHPIDMHHDEASPLTNTVFSKALQQPCAGVLTHLRERGLSKTEVLINKCTNAGKLSWDEGEGAEGGC